MAGLKFRVLLDTNSSSEVFRDVLINSEANFEEFYSFILDSFNFSKDQMASFYMSNDDWDKGEEVTLMDMSFGDEPSPILTMSNSIVGHFIEEPDQKIILVHDFMRMWIFLIELQGYQEVGPDQPEIILSVGDAPDEESKKPEDNDGLFIGSIDEDEDEDEFGFNDFSGDFSDEDLGSFDDYEF